MFAVNNTQIGVVANAGQAVTMTGQSIGTVAATPLDLEATAHTMDSERDRFNKETEVEIGGKINQDASKTNESQQAMFTTLVSIEEGRQEAARHMISNMKR